MGRVLISGATAEPISTTEAKAHLRVDSSTDDTLIAALVRSAREYCEAFTARQLVSAYWRLTLDEFPAEDTPIKLFASPARSIISVTYTDTAGAAQTVTASDYSLITSVEPAQVISAYETFWPSTRDITDAVAVNFYAGYSAPFTASAATDTLTVSNRGLTNGDRVRLSNSGGALPAGLSADTDYYIVNASGATCKLSTTSGGSAVDITDAGTGTHFIGEIPASIIAAIKLIVGDLYEHREATMDANTYTNQAVMRLLWPYRIMEAY